VVSVEQTANIGGGTIWKKSALDDVVKIAKANGLATHMDGARLLNACVATGISANDMAAGWDSAWIDFSKGLGAPIGGVIAGSSDFIDVALRNAIKDGLAEGPTILAVGHAIGSTGGHCDSVPAPLNPKQGKTLTDAQVRGQGVYQRAECGTCHGGSSLTNNTYAHVGTDEASPKNNPMIAAFPNGGVNVPSLLGIARTAPPRGERLVHVGQSTGPNVRAPVKRPAGATSSGIPCAKYSQRAP
jgi:mono/diheme cytochrome c family protein